MSIGDTNLSSFLQLSQDLDEQEDDSKQPSSLLSWSKYNGKSSNRNTPSHGVDRNADSPIKIIDDCFHQQELLQVWYNWLKTGLPYNAEEKRRQQQQVPALAMAVRSEEVPQLSVDHWLTNIPRSLGLMLLRSMGLRTNTDWLEGIQQWAKAQSNRLNHHTLCYLIKSHFNYVTLGLVDEDIILSVWNSAWCQAQQVSGGGNGEEAWSVIQSSMQLQVARTHSRVLKPTDVHETIESSQAHLHDLEDDSDATECECEDRTDAEMNSEQDVPAEKNLAIAPLSSNKRRQKSVPLNPNEISLITAHVKELEDLLWPCPQDRIVEGKQYSKTGGKRKKNVGAQAANKRIRWLPAEEYALLRGLLHFGYRHFTGILRHEEFGPCLFRRKPSDLKDKLTNILRAASRQGPKMHTQ